jgi:hypothetical protein
MQGLFKKQNLGQLLLVILFIIYLIMGYRTPDALAQTLNTMPGKIVLIIIAGLLLMCCHPVLGILGIIVAYELVRRSNPSDVGQYVPSESQKSEHLTAFNQFPYTLEQEMVSKMAPEKNIAYLATPSTFKPILEDNYDAAPI